jgi:hypothetical protein
MRSISVASEPAIVNLDLAALGPTQLPERLPKRGNAGLSFRIAFRKIHQHANAPHPLALLRPRRERPSRCRASEKRDELAPSHVGHGLPPFPLCAGATGVEDHNTIMSGYDFWKYTCHCRCIRVLLLSQSGERPERCRSFLCALSTPAI